MFLNRPATRHTGEYRNGRPVKELLEDLVFESTLNGLGIRIVVPKGTQVDLASTPWWLWWLFPPDGPWEAAVILHDYLYSLSLCSRFLADALMREALHSIKEIRRWRRIAMYYAVRLFGKSHKTKALPPTEHQPEIVSEVRRIGGDP